MRMIFSVCVRLCGSVANKSSNHGRHETQAAESIMHIILGYELDTGSYPDALGNDEARQGVVVLGPAGLVGVLETRLGLTRIQGKLGKIRERC